MSQGLSPCFPAGGDARTKVRAYLRGKGGRCAGGPGPISEARAGSRREVRAYLKRKSISGRKGRVNLRARS